ncbi:hypothetical protein RhiirC2_780284 [Rhizophagus irregularis]|uniref:Ricin B lectin domain-containing protein n=1 Tax=Rhizophagus irregularis TaxID=588596 RepID=A0A2N1N816_9GLOM|nr:hypothetical protein RhiirC2_780284 [Rhizophagus irregularis]
MKFNFLLLLSTALTAVAQLSNETMIIQSSGSDLFWALDNIKVVLKPREQAANWTIIRYSGGNYILPLPYDIPKKSVQYNGPGKQLTVEKNLNTKWLFEPESELPELICSSKQPNMCATEDEECKVIALCNGAVPRQRWIFHKVH